MTLNPVLFPPSDQFWQRCAHYLVSALESGGDFEVAGVARMSPVDFSAIRVIVPAFEHAQWLISALEQELGRDFIAPRINTLSGWLALQVPSTVSAVAEGERLMVLYAQLREHAWLKKLFSARRSTDLLPLAQTLLTLSDELTEAMLPQVLSNVAERTWHDALAQLPLPAQRMLSDEAQLVWRIWTSQLDERDAISLHFAQLQQLAQLAPDPLLWINPVEPTQLELEFLTRYAHHNVVQTIGLDWRAGAVDARFSHAWHELLEPDPHAVQEHAAPINSALQHHRITTLAADSLEQEAQSGAQIIFEWLQQGKSSIALIAQDRVVARRIRALLQRANVYVSDETGWKLSTTRAAAALTAWFEVVVTRADTVMLLDLLKSPFLIPCPEPDPAVDVSHPVWADSIMMIEMALLRANVVGGWESIEWALASVPAGLELITRMKYAASQFSGQKKLTDWLKQTREAMQQLGMETALQRDLAGDQVVQLLDQLANDCQYMAELFSLAEWRAFLNLQLESTAFYEDKQDQRVVMLPLNGARLRSFDAVLMAGCDAAHLPSQPKEMLFFTNAVRRECGLLTREQRQRQQLRDFTALLSSNPEVVLSWQGQQRNEYNPVSPWIARLNLTLQCGADANHGLESRQLPAHSVSLSRKMVMAIEPRQPHPAAPALQPKTLSASGLTSLLACPYQFFSARMLGLSSLDTLSDMPEKRDYGDWLHAILKTYHDTLKNHVPPIRPDDQEALLRTISQDAFAEILQKSPAALGYSVRWEKAISAYIAWSQRYAAQGWQFDQGEIWLEKKLSWGVEDESQILLRGQIDRLDKNAAGEYAVLDYKTRSVSALNKKLAQSEDQQLSFYGLLAASDATPIVAAHYVALEPERDKVGDAPAPDFAVWTTQVQQTIIMIMSAIGQGQPLVAQGVEEVCQYCEVRGLCRKGAWQ